MNTSSRPSSLLGSATSVRSVPCKPAVALLVGVLVLAGCGGGGSSNAVSGTPAAGTTPTETPSPSPTPSPATTPTSAPVPTPSPTPAPTPTPASAPIAPRDAYPIANASTRGAWGPVVNWPLIPIHAALLPDGRVMTYGTKLDGTQTARFNYDVWTPSEGTGDDSHLTLQNFTSTDIFCSAQIVLQSGDLLMNGGDNYSETAGRSLNTPNPDVTIYTRSNNELRSAGTMNRARWYASAITLPDGRIYIQGGLGGTDFPEVREANGSYRLLTGVPTRDLFQNYPRNFVAPDGKVISFAIRDISRIDPAGNGTRVNLGDMGSFWPGETNPFVMYAPGKVLMAGGDDARTAIIDINGATPVIEEAGPMSATRRWGNATVLADGRVAAVGGSRVDNELVDVAYGIDLFNPTTKTWSPGPQALRSRLYHSISLLLPDATLMTGGGGAVGPVDNLNVEIYYPPYLFGADGRPKRRPVLSSAPTVAAPRTTLRLPSPDAADIRRITLVATGSVTHSFDANQRFMELSFQRQGTDLVASLPDNPYLTPPGYYMLFLIDSAGTPSIARIIRIPPV